jgi:uncharacterized protein (TIGR04255 family)
MPVTRTANLAPLNDAPLRLALVQVRTPPMFAVDRADAVESLATELPPQWVLVEEGRTQRVQMQVMPGGIAQSTPEAAERVWRFETTDRQYVATLTPTSIGVETTHYGDFGQFRAHIEPVLQRVAEHADFRPRLVTRLGVRYVNEMHDERLHDDEAMSAVVHPELLGPATTLGTGLLASLQELRFQQPDGILAVRHGLTTPGQYLLDSDHYSEERQDFDVPRITALVQTWHDTIEGVFAWAFAPWLRERGVLT